MRHALLPTALPIAKAYDFADPESDDSDAMWYATVTQNLANRGEPQSTLQVDAAVDFYWLATTFQANVTNGAQTESTWIIPNVHVRVQDAASQKYLQNLRYPLSEYAGPGECPYRLVAPRKVLANSTLVFYWRSFDTTNTYANVFMVLHGYTRPAGA